MDEGISDFLLIVKLLFALFNHLKNKIKQEPSIDEEISEATTLEEKLSQFKLDNVCPDFKEYFVNNYNELLMKDQSVDEELPDIYDVDDDDDFYTIKVTSIASQVNLIDSDPSQQ